MLARSSAQGKQQQQQQPGGGRDETEQQASRELLAAQARVVADPRDCRAWAAMGQALQQLHDPETAYVLCCKGLQAALAGQGPVASAAQLPEGAALGLH